MRRWGTTRAIAIAGSVLAAACGSGGAPPGASDDLATFCARFCDRTNACQPVPSCQDSCTSDRRVAFSKLRADVVSQMIACFGQSSCEVVQRGELLTDCQSQAAGNVQPSPAAGAFCDGWIAAEAACHVDVARSDCLGLVGVYSDATLAEAQTCPAQPCSQIQPCLDRSFVPIDAADAGGGPIPLSR